MPEVVSNTSPLQYLFQLQILDVLHALVGRVVVPPAVVAELAEGRHLGQSLPDPSRYEWISIRSATSTPASLVGNKKLGRGECEAIALAAELGTAVILDDAVARRFATRLGIPTMGILRVLLDAKKAALIPLIEPLIDRLQSLGFYLDPATRLAVLELAGEQE